MSSASAAWRIDPSAFAQLHRVDYAAAASGTDTIAFVLVALKPTADTAMYSRDSVQAGSSRPGALALGVVTGRTNGIKPVRP